MKIIKSIGDLISSNSCSCKQMSCESIIRFYETSDNDIIEILIISPSGKQSIMIEKSKLKEVLI